MAACAYGFRLTPNTVTAISAVLSFLGLILLLVLPYSGWTGLAVAVLLALGFVFDSADGQLARLYGRSSKAGEWLDHVVDALRAPSVHAAVAGAVILKDEAYSWLVAVALLYGVITSAQFLSQILAGAMVRSVGKDPVRGGNLRSFLLLPTDTGTLCWAFVLWGFPTPFAVIYSLLAAIAVLHATSSMLRRYRDLLALDASKEVGKDA